MKAQADFVSMFFLVLVVLAVVFAFLFFEHGILVVDIGLDAKERGLGQMTTLRNTLFRCYGYPVPVNISGGCNSLENSETILGWSLEQLDFGYCQPTAMYNDTPDDYSNIVTYLVPIRNNETICPGELRMFI